MKNRTASSLRLSAALGAAALLGVSLTGCSAIAKLQQSTADAWAVTYEVTVEGVDTATLTDVSYLDQEMRTAERTSVDAGTVTASSAGDGTASWKVDSIVVVGDNAKVSATAAAGERATCSILLDGEREIATATSEPGSAVTCEATAPPFDK